MFVFPALGSGGLAYNLETSSGATVTTGNGQMNPGDDNLLVAFLGWKGSGDIVSIESPLNSFTLIPKITNGNANLVAGYVLSSAAETNARFTATLDTDNSYRFLTVWRATHTETDQIVTYVGDNPRTGSGTIVRSYELSSVGESAFFAATQEDVGFEIYSYARIGGVDFPLWMLPWGMGPYTAWRQGFSVDKTDIIAEAEEMFGGGAWVCDMLAFQEEEPPPTARRKPFVGRSLAKRTYKGVSKR